MSNIVSCSLGKDSVALLILMLENAIPVDRIVFADIGPEAEFEETYEFLRKVEQTLGVTIEQVRSNKWTWDSYFFSPCVKGARIGRPHGFPPNSGRGRCSYKRELKTKPLDAAMGKGNTVFLGIAVDERERAEAKRYKNAPNEYRFPLVEWGITEAECRKLCEDRGLLHPLYKYFKRLGCWQCPNQSLDALRTLRHNWPEKWMKLREYQLVCDWPYKTGAGDVEQLEKRFAKEDANNA